MLHTIWNFFQNEVLGMHWLNRLIGTGLEAVGLDIGGKIGGTVQFFLYDVIKIMVLLGFLIFLISYIQSYFPPERTKRMKRSGLYIKFKEEIQWEYSTLEKRKHRNQRPPARARHL